MIISPARKFIFVHAPKTGGTALSLALEDRAHKDDVLVGDTPKAVKRRGRVKKLPTCARLTKHSTLADLEGWLSLGDLDAYFIFMLVRNPWDRWVSYYHWLQNQTFDHPAVRLAKSLDFEGFVLDTTNQAALRASSVRHYLTDAAGRERAASFVRLEHLASDLAPVEAHLGFSLAGVPRVNVSARDRDYRGYYSDATRAVVASAAAEDIARFNYTFG